ncbi:MAG: recombinase family protein, partial [Microthrixaceae bacterium]
MASTRVSAAAIYARISQDDGTALGVTRQVEDCRQLARELGWTVAEEYIDNDVSAYSGKRRPAYEAMLADIADGSRDGVIVYHADRLTRRPIELEQFLDVVSGAGVSQVKFVAGTGIDVGTGDGLM